VLLIRLMITNWSYTYVFIEEGGWNLYKLISRADSVNLANNRSTKLRTLICSRTRGRSAPPVRTVRSSFWYSTYAPCLLVDLSKSKATNPM
jgi:hypothetical protein